MPTARTKIIAGSLLLLTAGGIALKWDSVRRSAILAFDVGYAVTTSNLEPSFDGPDVEREQVAVTLVPVLEGLSQPVDLQPIPGTAHQALVLQKTGELWWANLASGEKHQLLDLEVVTESEQGLLGAALSPDFSTSKRVFLDYVARNGSDFTVIQEFTLEGELETGRLVPGKILLTVEQPYQNHNAGQLAFGPDGMLYITMGDGGFRFDPKGNGQNRESLLGSILRVDVSVPGALSVPPDNPFVGQEGVRPELWAIGLRNPWRMSFAPDGRLIVADVGQDKWEEINLVQGGDNLGWNTMEGTHCLEEGCQAPADHVPPIYEYGHEEGQSITGGYAVRSPSLPELQGLYIFGDFVRGRIWAIELPTDRSPVQAPPRALGRWPVLISSFGQDAAGELYVLDYGQGRILRIQGSKTDI
ncbi:MAG: glucose/arabinose dehydrogenase [Cognaticolwellia sp.]